MNLTYLKLFLDIFTVEGAPDDIHSYYEDLVRNGFLVRVETDSLNPKDHYDLSEGGIRFRQAFEKLLANWFKERSPEERLLADHLPPPFGSGKPFTMKWTPEAGFQELKTPA